jgi:hypothetical protein
MKKSDHFAWTLEAQEALDHLKNLLKSPAILTALAPEEPMLLHIAATTQVVSVALVVEREEPGRLLKVQCPVYFVSEVLSDLKTGYSQMQKLVYTVLITKRKLRHYFDAHHITVVSKYPLGEVTQNPEAKVRITKWALELMGQNISYAPRSAIKSQVLADIVAEWTEIQTPPAPIEHGTRTMYFDGSVMKEGAGVGLVVYVWSTSLDYTSPPPKTSPSTTHSSTAFESWSSSGSGISRIRGDSELVVDQVVKEKNCVDLKMATCC